MRYQEQLEWRPVEKCFLLSGWRRLNCCPSQGFQRESLFQKRGPTVGLTQSALAQTFRGRIQLHRFRVRTPERNSL
jgi:hypothetical protein